MWKRTLAAFSLAIVISAPALSEPERNPLAEMDAALQNALRSLESFIERFPGYEAPEVTPEGDIIIRKKRPDGARDPKAPEGKGVRRI